MINVTIRYGATNELTKELPSGTTVGDVLRNSSIKVGLGFGDNVQAVVDGTVQPASNRLADGDIITIETRANSKASKN